MKTLKINHKHLTILGWVLICAYTAGNAQDYGQPSPPPPQNYSSNQNSGNTAPSGYVSLNFGLSNPEGSFANSTGSGYGGYALSGDAVHLSLGVPINHSNFGVAFMFGNYNNQYNLNSYASNNFEYPVYPDQNYYSISSIMGGLYVTIPVGIVSFDGRFMVGVLLNTLPEQDYQYNDAQENNYQYDLLSSNSTSFAYDLGVGARCLLAQFGRRKLCVMVNLDYLGSSVPYNTEQIEYYTPAVDPNNIVYQTNNPVSGSSPVQLFNVTLGLGYQF